MFLKNWIGFAAKTDFGIVSEYFCRIEMILRLRQIWNCLRIFL